MFYDLVNGGQKRFASFCPFFLAFWGISSFPAKLRQRRSRRPQKSNPRASRRCWRFWSLSGDREGRESPRRLRGRPEEKHKYLKKETPKSQNSFFSFSYSHLSARNNLRTEVWEEAEASESPRLPFLLPPLFAFKRWNLGPAIWTLA